MKKSWINWKLLITFKLKNSSSVIFFFILLFSNFRISTLISSIYIYKKFYLKPKKVMKYLQEMEYNFTSEEKIELERENSKNSNSS